MIHLNPANWFFCETCDTIAYSVDCCHGTTCNGYGCPECGEIQAAATKMILDGMAPAKDSVPFVPSIKTREKKYGMDLNVWRTIATLEDQLRVANARIAELEAKSEIERRLKEQPEKEPR